MTAIPEGRKWLTALFAGAGALSIVLYVMVLACLPIVWVGFLIWVIYTLTKHVLAR